MTSEERSDKLLALVERIAVALEARGIAFTSPQSQPTLKEIPNCPLCNKPMIYRTARATGEKFWGCQDYPTCIGGRNEQGKDTTRVTSKKQEFRHERDL